MPTVEHWEGPNLLLVSPSGFLSPQTLLSTFCSSLLCSLLWETLLKFAAFLFAALNLRGNFSALSLFEEENVFLSHLQLTRAFIFSRQVTSGNRLLEAGVS